MRGCASAETDDVRPVRGPRRGLVGTCGVLVFRLEPARWRRRAQAAPHTRRRRCRPCVPAREGRLRAVEYGPLLSRPACLCGRPPPIAASTEWRRKWLAPRGSQRVVGADGVMIGDVWSLLSLPSRNDTE